MANLYRPGFRWVGSMYAGANAAPPIIWGAVADDYDGDLGGANMDLCIGMPVRYANTGTFTSADAGATIFGIICAIGAFYDPNLGQMRYGNTLPNQTSYDTLYERESRIGVIPVQGQLFRVQCDDATSATTYAAYRTLVGNNGDHVYVSGSAPAGKVLLDISDVVATATSTAQWRVEAVPDRDSQDFASTYVDLIVSCNEMQRNSTTGI